MSRVVLVVAVALVLFGVHHALRPSHATRETSAVSNVLRGYVTKASDGDTLHVLVDGNKPVTVRVLGIDTPETHDPRKPVQCYGPEASAFTKSYATNRVTLTTEPSSGDVTDRYGRTLAYVYVQAHRADLGAVLIRRGFAKVYAYGNRHFARRAKYERLEAAAKSHMIGRWKECKS